MATALQGSRSIKSRIMNKSTMTNLIAFGVIVVGYNVPIYKDQILNAGYFALSGAFTNWLAVHMLFEKIPGLYGSGIIPSRFEEFKVGIKSLIMDQFFTTDNFESFFEKAPNESSGSTLDLEPILASIDYDQVFAKIGDAIMNSQFGEMLKMFGGMAALEPLKPVFTEKVKETITDIAGSQKFNDAIGHAIALSLASDEGIAKIDSIVQHRLDELTPQMVKDIIQEMIRSHLGWLVVWGGVFGGLIGLGASLVI